MKALVYVAPQSLELQELPMPKAQKGEALVRVEAVGICGSDMHAWGGHDERRPAPLILGHEAAGVVMSGKLEGQSVTINPLVTCGACKACQSGRDNLCPKRQIISMPPRAGAFAEYVAMPEQNLVVMPEGFSMQKASLAEPLACGWHAVRLGASALDQPLKSAQVVVQGGGAIGFGAALCLRAWGVNDVTIIEPNEKRLAFIKEKSDFHSISSEDELKVSPDMVIDCVGFQSSRATASKIVRPGGVIMHIGLGQSEGGLDIRRMTLQEITFIGTYTYTQQDFKDTAQAIFDGKLGALDWADIRHLDDGAAAFDDMASGQVASPKIILETRKEKT